MPRPAATARSETLEADLSAQSVYAQPGFLTRFRRRKMAVASLAFLLVLGLLALAAFVADYADVRFPYLPNRTDVTEKFLRPGWPHVMGTDQYGRDVLSRVLNASYISLTIGFLAVVISMTLGVTVGSVAGYFGGWVDNVLMRIVDAIISIPRFLLVLTIVAMAAKPSIYLLIGAIGVLSWMGTSRLVRAEFLTLRETDYVAAARALGAKPFRIIFRHILPNSLAPVFVSAVLGVAGAILVEAGLSFLGFGVQAPQASWGNIIADGRTYLLDAWWLIVFPGLAILVTTMAFYLVGEGIREVLDPKESKRI